MKWLVRNVELFVPLGTFVAKVIFDIQVRDFIDRRSYMAADARKPVQCVKCSWRINGVAILLSSI